MELRTLEKCSFCENTDCLSSMLISLSGIKRGKSYIVATCPTHTVIARTEPNKFRLLVQYTPVKNFLKPLKDPH